MSWIAANWMVIAGTAGSVVMGASIIVKAISKVTKNKKDDKVAKWLTVLNKWLSKIAINPKQ